MTGVTAGEGCFNLDCNCYKKQQQPRVIWNEADTVLIAGLLEPELKRIVILTVNPKA
jgi:hypothetical protein